MKEVYVYKGRDNPVTVQLVAEPRDEDADSPDPPLQAALRVTLKTENGLELDSEQDAALEMLDDTRIRMILGPEFAEKEGGLRGYLTIYYVNTPNGIAWPGSRQEQDQPTFLFLPVDWPGGQE